MNFPHFVVVEVQINALAVIPSQIGKQTADRQRFVVQKKNYICTILCTSYTRSVCYFVNTKKKILFFVKTSLMTFDTTQFVLHNVCRTWTIGNSNTISTKIIQTFFYMMQKKPRHKYLGFTAHNNTSQIV